MSYIFAALAIVFALLEILAVARNLPRLEMVAKPAAMLFLFLWLYVAGLRGPLLWFAFGILFSLVGDVFLLWPDRFFLPGLVAFLFAQISYLVGFNILLPPLSLWNLLLAFVLALGSARVLRRIIAGVHAAGQSRLAIPVLIYGVVITLMLLSAVLTLSNTRWQPLAAISAALGAFLFYMSDIVLAWNRFVAPLPRGRLLNISLYEAGQVLLVTGVILQFS